MNFYLKRSIRNLLLSLLAIVAVNGIASKFYHRFDLTAEKRYTLTNASQSLLKELDQNIVVDVYLEGDKLPAGIKRLRNETRELLQELRSVSNGKVTYQFIDLNAISKPADKEKKQSELVDKGLRPINLEVKSSTGYSENLIFPGAIIRSGNREIPIQILENQFAFGTQGALDNSLNFLEYKLVNAIQKIIRPNPLKVAFLQGHGETDVTHLQEFLKTLAQQNFLIDKMELDKDELLNSKTDVLVIAKPQQALNDPEKFLIDQYVMQGGRVLWLLDVVRADLDDFQLAPYTVAAPRALNIEDLLFRYGVRLNPNLVLDLYCTQIPIIESIGGNPQPKLYPWPFFPIAIGQGKHPIVKNIDPVMLRFCTDIDTLGNPGVRKTILLTTSTYSRSVATPFQIFLEGARQRPDPNLFNKKDIPLAVLLEGEFRSFYQNQYTADLQQVLNTMGATFKAKSAANKMIVVADGDVASNDIDSKNVPLPLGYDKFTRQQFSNKDFLLNCVEYLVDDKGLIEARNREIRMRLLDKAKIADQKNLWQVVNIGLPLLLTGLFIVGFNNRRKKRYAA